VIDMKLSRNFFRIQHTDPTLLPEKIDEFVEIGLGLELRDFMLPSLLDSSEDLAMWIEVYREINDGRLSFSIHGPVIDLNLGSPDEKIRQVSIERIIQIFRVEEGLSAEFLIIHTGYDPRFLNEKNRFKSWISRSLESFSWIFEKVNLPKCLRAICIENSPGEPSEAYWIYLRALKNEFADIPLRACIDYDHLLSKEKRLVYQYLKDPMVVYLHLPWRRAGQTICRNLPSEHNLQAICFEGEFREGTKQRLQRLVIDVQRSSCLI